MLFWTLNFWNWRDERTHNRWVSNNFFLRSNHLRQISRIFIYRQHILKWFQYNLSKYSIVSKLKSIFIKNWPVLWNTKSGNSIWSQTFFQTFFGLTLSIWELIGGYLKIYFSPRSTLQLKFSAKHLWCIAGIIIIASHNPIHYKGKNKKSSKSKRKNEDKK